MTMLCEEILKVNGDAGSQMIPPKNSDTCVHFFCVYMYVCVFIPGEVLTLPGRRKKRPKITFEKSTI